MSKRIIANWKMNMGNHQAAEFLREILENAPRKHSHEIVICPPFTVLRDLYPILNSPFFLGAQDVSKEECGAFTGSISASMLKDSGCRYVIVGHSESRAAFSYTNADIRAKAKKALEHSLVPVVCVGEDLNVRQKGDFLECIRHQAQESLPLEGDCLLAYEPLWAINTGYTACMEDIRTMRDFLSSFMKTPFLYGGSVNEGNIASIISCTHGVLVGGASLKKESFINLLNASCM